MQAWVTPEDAPGSPICIRVICPSGVEYEAALRGAILSLTETENWENVNGQTETVVAEAFFDAYQETLDWRRCVPVGTVYNFGGDTVPEGSLLCDGASYDTDNYPALFEAIGYIWGGGGSSFSVPDMRERFALGVGPGAALATGGGVKTHTLTVSEMPSHNHSIAEILAVGGTPNPVPVNIPSIIPALFTGNTGGDGSHENMPPFKALLSCIVAK